MTFGRPQVISIATSEAVAAARVDELVRALSSAAKRTYALGGLYKYSVPSQDVSLSSLFARVSSWRAEGVPIVDWAVHSATLEDVFIGLVTTAAAAKGASAEAAK